MITLSSRCCSKIGQRAMMKFATLLLPLFTVKVIKEAGITPQ